MNLSGSRNDDWGATVLREWALLFGPGLLEIICKVGAVMVGCFGLQSDSFEFSPFVDVTSEFEATFQLSNRFSLDLSPFLGLKF